MNEPTTLGGQNEALRRRYGVPGQQGPILTLASDLFPVVNVGDELMAPELQFLAGSRLCIGGATDAADAGLPSGVQVMNPVGSGIIAVVQGASVTSTAGQNGAMVFSATVSDTETSGFLRDARFAAGARASCLIGPRTAAALTGIAPILIGTGFVNLGNLLPWVLSPGTALFIQGGTVNIAVTVAFTWRERALNTWEQGGG